MRTLIAAVFSVLALATSAPAQTATLTMLPDEFQPWDISGDGRLLVGRVTNVTPNYAARWTREAGVQPIPKPPTWGATLARAVSHDGTVIAGEAATPEGVRAFVYKPETGMVALGVLPSASSSISLGVSSSGEWTCGNSGFRAYRYHVPTGVMVPLRTTSGEDSWDGSAVSDTGVVVGTAYNDEGRRAEPIEWPTPNTTRQLGPRWGNTYGGAWAITPDGSWIAGTSDTAYLGQLGNPFPRLWDDDRTPIELIAPGTPFVHGVYPTAIMNGGVAASCAIEMFQQPNIAGLWTPQSATVELWPLLTQVFGLSSPHGTPTGSLLTRDGSALMIVWNQPLNGVKRAIVDWQPPCDSDCTLDWERDMFDFLCFLNKYVVGDPYPCDFDERTYSGSGGGVCNIHDLLAFQRRFVEGCW